MPSAVSAELGAELDKGDAVGLGKWLRTKLADDLSRGVLPGQFISDRNRVQLLLLHRFMSAFPPEEMQAVFATPRGRQFIREVICEESAVKGIWALVPSDGKARAWKPGTLDVWVELWSKQGASERRKFALLGAACASALGGKGIKDRAGNPLDPFATYAWFRRMAEQGNALVPLEKLNFDECFVLISAPRSLVEMDYMRKTTKPKMARWNTVAVNCWRIKYTRFNKEGVSVQRGNEFYNGQPQTVDVLEREGGVCGAISNFGVAACRAFGVPATTVSQPGHCAFVWLGPDFKWQLGNDVHGWSDTASTGDGISGPGKLNPWGVKGDWLRVVERLRAAPASTQKAELFMAAAECFTGPARTRLLEQAALECDFHPSPWMLLVKDAAPADRPKLLEKARGKLKGYPQCATDILSPH